MAEDKWYTGTMLRGASLVVLGLCIACVSSGPTPPAPQQRQQPSPSQAQEAEPLPPPVRVVRLDDGTSVELRPGVERGFSHCCGNDSYMLEIDCSDGLMRCYERPEGQWKQTFGRHCKSALSQECYEHSCDQVCEAFRVFENQLE